MKETHYNGDKLNIKLDENLPYDANKRARLGRSAPRTRLGCATCKFRKVKCDQKHPFCSNCIRLELNCVYLPVEKRRSKKGNGNNTGKDLDNRLVAVNNSITTNNINKKRISNIMTNNGNDFNNAYITHNNVNIINNNNNNNNNNITNTLENSRLGNQLDFGNTNLYNRPNGPNFENNNKIINDNDNNSNVTNNYVYEYNPILNDLTLNQSECFLNFPNVYSNDNKTNDDNNIDKCLELSQINNSLSNNFLKNSDLDLDLDGMNYFKFSEFIEPCLFSLENNLLFDKFEKSTRVDFLLNYFKNNIQLPVSSVIDTEIWLNIKFNIIELAKNNLIISKSICALSDVFISDKNCYEVNLKNNKINDSAILLYKSAKEQVEIFAQQYINFFSSDYNNNNNNNYTIDNYNINTHTNNNTFLDENSLLVCIFLLGFFELICRDKLHNFAEEKLLDLLYKQNKRNIFLSRLTVFSKKLLHLLLLIDAKAIHLGGQGVFGMQSGTEVRKLISLSTLSKSYDFDNDSQLCKGPTTYSDCDFLSSDLYNQNTSNTSLKDKETNKIINTNNTSNPLNKYIFRQILKPGIDFHFISQSFVREVASLDRYHRIRGTVEAEHEVSILAEDIRKSLDNLWLQYTTTNPILSASLNDLKNIFGNSNYLANQLHEYMCIYRANFWTNYVYLHRVAFWDLPHDYSTSRALKEIWEILKEYWENILLKDDDSVVSNGNNINDCIYTNGNINMNNNHNNNKKRSSYSSLLSELMWPMFMYGVESKIENNTTWVINQFRKLHLERVSEGFIEDLSLNNGNLDFADKIEDNTKSSGVSFLCLNAGKAADLLEELVHRQKKSGTRMDIKKCADEMFGSIFSII